MIRFDSVTKTYPGQAKPALNDIGVEILRGEFVFLVGASGSGKSSFLRLILKEEKPSSGTIHVLGQNLGSISSRKVPYFRRDLGVVFQDFRLLRDKSVYENVAFTLRVIGKSRGYIHTAVPETLKLVGLDGKGKRMPHELSGGEQQRVAIARAIVNKPQILLADEPTGNLDPVTSAGIMTLLERINAGGTTVVMATHEAGIVNEMRRRVIELSAGDIVRDERSAGYGAVQGTLPVDDDTAAAAAAVAAAEAASAALVHEQREREAAAADAAPAAKSKRAGRSKKRAAAEQPEPIVPAPETPPTVTAAAPKVTPEMMQQSQPLYVEPEATDEVTDAAAEITAAATASIEIPRGSTGGEPEASGDGGEPGDDAASGTTAATDAPADVKQHLTLAERLGLRAPGGPREGDDDQEVGPTR
ncbi:cell division transport system ATP-binding protein [Agromyces sp. CF514]|uniref:cell division ATP-binding protein FtsE n=1 Tax=Agromyces sp. CF514 TaxID=1881031 RepID=UPI0008E68397|nr:cell division ATP-binding protein FtsE [Agromyces sp. CF514]SFR74895.1 cell division transport system ATP-binding protein [Agromyces sp. CF514]